MSKFSFILVMFVVLAACEKKETPVAESKLRPASQKLSEIDSESGCEKISKLGLEKIIELESSESEKSINELMAVINQLSDYLLKESAKVAGLSSYMKKGNGCGAIYQSLFRRLDNEKIFNLIHSGTVLGLRLGFTLQKVSDGSLSESLMMSLGSTISKQPERFLQELKKVHSETYCSSSFFGNIGDYDDHLDEQSVNEALVVKKAQKRALESVVNPELIAIKNACLASLARSF